MKMVDRVIPTPSPIPTPSHGPYSLSEQINIATRPVHSQLNRLILMRLPLALPPYTTNPSIYISGLLHIAPIYVSFESLWQSILDAPRIPITLQEKLNLDACDPEQPLLDSKSVPIIPNTNHPPLIHAPKVCSRTHSLLAHVRLPGLLRAGRLRADIRVLTGTPDHKIDEQLEIVSKNGRLAEFITHTKQSVETNPHVLLAYAWVLYMALFSGGRYLRACLQGAGGSAGDFWDRDPSPVRPYSVTQQRRASKSEIVDFPRSSRPRFRNRSDSGVSNMVPGLQFFNFLGDEDGEDIKIEFKKRITEAEILLTAGEKEDIITEAQEIFNFMIEMVGELDTVMGTNEGDIETARLVQQNLSLIMSRDSLDVAQERLLKRTKTISAHLEQEQNHRRSSSYFEVLATGSVAKLVHFTDDLPTLGAMRKRFSKEYRSRDLSFKSAIDGMTFRSHDAAQWKLPPILLPILAVMVVFMAWYYKG